jgi:hypothetical protein
MFVCKNCGNLVEEIPTIKQCHGHTSLGQPLTETIDGLCSCGGDFTEATQCKICGEWFDNTELDGVCEVCIEEYETVGTALEIGNENPETVEGINGFAASVLTVEQINKILTKWVEENFVDHSKDVVKYCEDDKFYFSDYLADKYGE